MYSFRIPTPHAAFLLFLICLLCPLRSLGADMLPSGIEGIDAGEKMYQAGDAAGALKIFINVAEKAAEDRDYKMECLAEFNIGVVYLSLFSNGEALQHFQKAYDLCRRHSLGSGRETEIVSGIAGAFFQSKNYPKAKSTLHQALSIAYAHRDSMMIALGAQDMALICNQTEDFDSVGFWLNESRRFTPEGRPTAGLLSIAAETAMLRSDFEEADRLCREILETPANEDPNYALAYAYLFEMAAGRGEWAAAESYKDKALGFSLLSLKPQIFKVGADMYERQGDFRRALQYKDSLITYKDSLEKVNNRQLLDNSNVKLEVLKHQLEAEQTLERQKIQTWIWISVAIVFFFVIVISGILWRGQVNRNRTQREMLALRLANEQHEKELAEERMKETELISRYEQEMLKREIDRRNAQLQANALFVSSRNGLIEDLLKKMESLSDDNPEIRSLRSYLARMVGNDSKDQEELLTNVEAADPELSRKLMAAHPELLQSDLKFLGFVHMNMSMKEIAAILNVNPESCKRRKIRISKKLGLESSADLYSYLLQLTSTPKS